MWLRNLQVTNFRNFSHLNLRFSPGVNIFEGKNGEGKTNLLEAIYCLTRGLSFRTSREQRLIKWGEKNLYLKGEGEKQGNFLKYEFSLGKTESKRRKVNSHAVSLKNSKWWLWPVIFTSQDMKIVQSGPFYRRSFIDEVLSFSYPEFNYLKLSFNRVLNQRNMVLNQLKKGKNSKKLLDSWDFQLVKFGSKIVYLRIQMSKELSLRLKDTLNQLMGKKVSCKLVYQCSFINGETDKISLDSINELFTFQLSRIRQREIESGITLIGPHRDEFKIFVNGVDLRNFGSQGEQRVVAIGLRLVEAELIREAQKEAPLVLLDDITSDLDCEREKFLLKKIKSMGQVFLTCQDLSRLNKAILNESLIFHLKNGNVEAKDHG